MSAPNRCPHCNGTLLREEVPFEMARFRFELKCQNCGREPYFKPIEEEPTRPRRMAIPGGKIGRKPVMS